MPHIPKVSVILTSYNHEKYLRESIESVLMQTYSDFDFVIWDDGSTDGSWEIIKSYSDQRIRAFKNTTMPPGSPIRAVVTNIETADYIAIHHSDDVWEPQKLGKQVAFLDANPQIGAVFSNVAVIGEDGDLLEDNTHPYQKVFDQHNRSRHEWLNRFFYIGNALCHPSILIRSECYFQCGLYRYSLAQLADFDMWVRLCMKYDIHVLPEKLVRLRVRSNNENISGNRPDARIRGQFEYLAVLENYKNLVDPEDLRKIFPIAEKYIKPEGFDAGFILGMAALEPNTYNFTKLFGLELLIEAVDDPARAKKIKELYGFTSVDLITLTSQYDVFSVELIADLRNQVQLLSAQVTEKDQALSEKNQALSEKNQAILEKDQALDEIYVSRAWRFALFLRKIRVKLFPPKYFHIV